MTHERMELAGPGSGPVLLACVAAASLALLLQVRLLRVPSGSMEPTLHPGDVVLTESLSLRSGARPGWVVAARPGGEGEPAYLKRVAAVEGQVVALQGTALLRDGRVVREPHARYSLGGLHGLAPRRLGAGEVVLLGDARDRSLDSRSFGPVDREALIGRARWIVWPPRRFGAVR